MAAKRNVKTAAPNAINYAAMMTAHYASVETSIRSVLPVQAENANHDDFLDTVSGEAASVKSADDLVAGFNAIAGAEKAAGEAGEVMRLRKFVFAAKACRNISYNLGDKGSRETLLARMFPNASNKSLGVYGSHLAAFLKAEEAGLLGDLVTAMRQRVAQNGGRLFDAVKGALSAASKAAKGHTGSTMRMPDPVALDAIIEPKVSTPSVKTAIDDPAKRDERVNAAASGVKGYVKSAADVETLLTLMRAKLEAFLPKAQGPVTDKADLAPKA